MTAIPAVPSEPPLTDDAALSDAELAEIARLIEAADIQDPLNLTKQLDYSGDFVAILDDGTGVEARIYVEETADLIVAAVNALPRLVASLRSAREELMSARAERVELIAERDEAQAKLKRVRHALAVVQAARPPLAHSAAIVEQLALAVRAREMKPEQISADEAERGYHNAINGYREVARAILRDIDKALTVEEGTNRG